jgi:hypothetical protein
MTRITRTVLSLVLTAGICSPALAQPTEKAPEKKPTTTAPAKAGQPGGEKPAMQLPPGVTAEDMKACEEAGTPGPMHEWMAKCSGTYQGKVKMWMTPEAPVQEATCTTTITLVYGKFLRVESKGDMMGMPFEGTGVYGYDNVSKKFQSVWFDNMGTGMVTGTGSLSTDGKVLTLNEKFNCPIQKKEIPMREVQTYHDDGSMTLEMFSQDKSGKEFRTMEITYAAKPGAEKHTDNKGTEMKAKPNDTVPAKK